MRLLTYAALKILVHVFVVHMRAFVPLGCIPRSEIVGSNGKSISTLIR